MTASRPSGKPSAQGTGGIDQPDLQDLKRDVEQTADVAVERGRGFASAARGHALNFAEDRKSETARSIADLAQSLRDSGQTFEDRPNIKAFFESAAEGLHDLSGSIETRSFGDIYDEAEAYARRSPVTVAVATFAAGLLLARFVKASGTRDGGDGLRA